MKRVLEAGRLSPPAANRQPWHFIVVKDELVKEKLRSAYSAEWFLSAPIIIVVCADPSVAWSRKDGEEIWKIDAAIALDNGSLCLGWGTWNLLDLRF